MSEHNRYDVIQDTTEEMERTTAPGSRKERPFRRMLRKGASLVLSGILLGTVTAGTFYGVNQFLPDSGTVQSAAADTTLSASTVLATLSSTSGTSVRYGMDVTDIAEIALPCVVSITNISVQEVESFFDRFGPNGSGQSQLEETTSCGSGVIIYSDEAGDALYIVTNQHVVADATTLSVSFVDNSVYEAQLCGTDEELDLAVLKVALSDLSEETLEQISVIAIGDSDELAVGEQVVAIGNALGYGQSVTTGIVSALNRSMTNESGVTMTYIQTDAAINPGNSGGALLNLDGELIGINTAKVSSTDVEGMGYAIPISDVIERIAELMTETTELSQQTTTQQSSSLPQMPSWNGGQRRG